MKYLLIIFLFFSNIAYTQIQAVGDVMLGESKKNLFNPVLDDFKNENYINLINLEGVVSDPLNNKKCLNQKNCFTFLQKPKVIDFLKEAKVQVVNLANNHVMDFDIQGLENTINHLLKLNTHIIGLSNHNFKELSFKNKKFVFIGMSPHQNTQSIFQLDSVLKKIKELKSLGYIIVVTAHIGAEGNNKYQVNGYEEFFYGQSRGNPMKLAHQLIDNGADLFIGHGPHVLRPLELYKNKLIAYSLGNFITYGQFDLSNNLSLGGILRVELKNNGDFSHAYFFGYQQTKKIMPNFWKNEVALIQSDESFQFLKKITTEHSKKIQSKEITFNEMTYEIR